MNNNPVRYTDPSGHWLESALDIAYDIYDISTNGLNWENGLSLVADVAGLALPVVTGGGLAVRALTHADDAVKGVNKIDNVLDAANAIDNVIDATKAAENTIGIVNEGDNLADAVKLVDGMEMGVDDALNAATDFLGNGYKEVGPGRFVSDDGLRQVKMTADDLATVNNHAGKPHINFEVKIPKSGQPGRYTNRNYHVFIME